MIHGPWFAREKSKALGNTGKKRQPLKLHFSNRRVSHRKKKLIAIIGYFRTFKEYLQKSQIWQSETKSQPGNSQPSSLVRTCLPLPNLGFLWVFFKYPIFSCVRDYFKFFFATQEKTLGFSAHGPQQKVNCIQTPGETKNNLYFFLK